ncbi:MAG: hypothetical protein AAFQ82_26155, partial [Myxococcota bacterium]
MESANANTDTNPSTSETTRAQTVRARFDALWERLPDTRQWTEHPAIEQFQDYRHELERRFEDTVTSVLASL